MKKPELLIPAGDFEKLEYAFLYGADAAYVSGKRFGLRKRAGNFSDEELESACLLAHAQGKNLYVTVNACVRNDDLDDLRIFLKTLEDIQVDALIVADPGVFKLASSLTDIPIHISTQTNTLNIAAVRFWADLGAKRVCLARELSKSEIGLICEEAGIQIEVFVHGAMCISHSGRCLISKYMVNRDANDGDCAQSCRWQYYLVEDKNPNKYFPIDEDGGSTFLYNSQDLCLAKRLPELIDIGCASFKVEGRMKSVNYVATVTKVYREIIDKYVHDPGHFRFEPRWASELENISHREYSEGFYSGDDNAQILNESGYRNAQNFVGTVHSSSDSGSLINVRNFVSATSAFIAVTPSGPNIEFSIDTFHDPAHMEYKNTAHANEQVFILMPNLPVKSIIRIKGGN